MTSGLPSFLRFKKKMTYVFDRAYIDWTYWSDIEAAEAFFVSRLKNSGTRLAYVHQTIDGFTDESITGVLYDGLWKPSATAKFRGEKRNKNISFRHIVYRDPETKKVFDFVTNHRDKEKVSAQTVANIYRKRWQVELLFRWLKGHLGIRRFYSRNKKAIQIHLMFSILIQLLIKLAGTINNSNSQTQWELLREIRSVVFKELLDTIMNSEYNQPPAVTPNVDESLGMSGKLK